MTLRLNGSTSGYSEIDAPAVAGNQVFTLPGTGGTLDRLNRAGNVLQVVQTFKPDTFSTTSNTFVDLTGLSASITPSSTSNKVLIYYYVGGSAASAGFSLAFRITRDGSAIAVADAAGSRLQSNSRIYAANADHILYAPGHYLDSPSSTSALTYKIQTCVQTSGTGYINRSGSDANSSNPSDSRSASGLILMEVAA